MPNGKYYASVLSSNPKTTVVRTTDGSEVTLSTSELLSKIPEGGRMSSVDLEGAELAITMSMTTSGAQVTSAQKK